MIRPRGSRAPSIAMRSLAGTIALSAWCASAGPSPASGADWLSPDRRRIPLAVDPRRTPRSNSPAAVEIDFPRALAEAGDAGKFDPDTIEVIGLDTDGRPRVFNPSRPNPDRFLLPWRLDGRYGTGRATLHFVMPDHACVRYHVYFDTVESGLGRPDRYGGLVGDGDRFTVGRGRREVNACGYDAFCDLDGDGDLDLFKGGIEPFVRVYENAGGGRMIDRGPLTSDGEVLVFPHDARNRSWQSVSFCDWDGDGDKDLIFGMAGEGETSEHYDWPHQNADPSKDAGFLFYRNVGNDGRPELARPKWIAAGSGDGRIITYLRPNVGDFVDFDGDGKRDFIGCEFENVIHLYRNTSSGPGGEPRFESSEKGIALVRPWTTQMISGADAIDFNRDGDIDIVTGQGHGGSGLRFFERDWIDDFVNETAGGRSTWPVVTAGRPESRLPPGKR